VSNLDRLVQGGAQEPTATPVPEPNSPAPTDSTKEQTSDTQALANNDQSLTQQLRDSIEDDASFSADAKTVQIITAENTVTLRGTVASQAEKDQLEAKAKQLAGIKNVDNQLQVKQ
jgi:osmotically-inducible protein OsmY